MAFTPNRYSEVDTRLAEMERYLYALADEIKRTAPDTDKRKTLYTATRTLTQQVAELRHLLQQAQWG